MERPGRHVLYITSHGADCLLKLRSVLVIMCVHCWQRFCLPNAQSSRHKPHRPVVELSLPAGENGSHYAILRMCLRSLVLCSCVHGHAITAATLLAISCRLLGADSLSGAHETVCAYIHVHGSPANCPICVSAVGLNVVAAEDRLQILLSSAEQPTQRGIQSSRR